jgi:ATP-binding cassette subfamily B protein/ATP-binding cassette subfamily C protein LapB
LNTALIELLAALRAQGSVLPARLHTALAALCGLAPHDPGQDLALADVRVLLQGAGWTLCPGTPRWDSAPQHEDPAAPWGSLWLGRTPDAPDGGWQLWQRSAQQGWQALHQAPAAPVLTAQAGWLLLPAGQPHEPAQDKAQDHATPYWGWVLALLRGRLAGILAASLLVNLGLVVLPLFAMLVYDKVVYNGVFETLWALAMGVLIFVAMELAVRQLRARQIERLALVLDERVDRQLFARLLQPTGRAGSQPGMAARFLTLYRDLAGARDFFSANYLLALADLPFVILIWLLIGLIAWPLLLVALLWTLVYLWQGGRIKRRSLQVSQAATRSQMAKQAVLTDAMSSLDVLRTSHAGGKLFQRFMRLADEHSLQNASLRHETQRQAHLTQIIYTGNFVSLIVVGAYLVFDQTITTGALVAVSMLSGRTLGVVGLALQTLGRWNELQQALRSLTPYLLAPPEAPRASLRRRPADVQGRVAVVELSHRYGHDTPVLQEINLSIAPGERIGVLGRPGSGKSTLSRLLAGAMLPSAGEVRVDELALPDHDSADRALWMAFKPQEPTLVAGTLEDNILLGLPERASQAERMAALQRGIYYAGLDQDLQRGSLSLSQPVEEYGANLSGGQRQKVALARALALDTRILILDEPTNALDPESEKLLVQRLGELQNLTLILVTHSARMLSLTERVLVLERGRVVADGATQALVKKIN